MSGIAKAFQIVLKASPLFPVVVEIVGDIIEAQAPDSPGGKKVTPGELAKLITEGGIKFVRALGKVFGVEVP